MNENFDLVDEMSRYGDPQRAATQPASLFTETVCFGIMCPVHGACRRYAGGDGSQPDAPRIGRCSDGGDRPGFLPITGSHA